MFQNNKRNITDKELVEYLSVDISLLTPKKIFIDVYGKKTLVEYAYGEVMYDGRYIGRYRDSAKGYFLWLYDRLLILPVKENGSPKTFSSMKKVVEEIVNLYLFSKLLKVFFQWLDRLFAEILFDTTNIGRDVETAFFYNEKQLRLRPKNIWPFKFAILDFRMIPSADRNYTDSHLKAIEYLSKNYN